MEPLGCYLKALALLRLIAEQADPEVLGWWDDDCFHIRSALGTDGLVEFFLNRYRPTPILSPWNAGSGFHTDKGRAVVDLIASSSDQRLASYREAINVARGVIEAAQRNQATTPDEDARRAAVLRGCRNLLPDSCVDWLDAANSISANGARTTAPILGTGGNEGNLEYGNHFMKYAALLLLSPIPPATATSLVRNALFGDDTDGWEPSSVGQFDPGRAGGKNQGPKMMTEKVPSNPWNFVLTLEGAVAWAAGLYRRQGVSCRAFLCSPFTVGSSPVGYGSSSADDKKATRAEIWTPLWSLPARYAEIRNILREGRASLEARPAKTGLEFAQAACALGVDRGITAFVRYNLLERRGKGYYIALSAGRFPVTMRTEIDLVRELIQLLERADAALRDAPPSYQSLRRRVDEAIYQLLLRGGHEALRDVASSFGRVHRWILNTAKPIRLPASLTTSWVEALAQMPEARIAGALAGIWDSEAGEFRDHLDRSSRRFSWTGSDLSARLVRALERRLHDAANAKFNPVRSHYYTAVTDAVMFLDGSVDETLVEDLLFTFSLIKWNRQPSTTATHENVAVWPVYGLLKHLFLPEPLLSPSGRVLLRSDPRVFSLLLAGDIQAAAEIALRKLQIAGFAPVQASYAGGIDSRRLAASLTIPVRYGTALRNAVLRVE
jgi:CRISPR-associated protein Csx17